MGSPPPPTEATPTHPAGRKSRAIFVLLFLLVITFSSEYARNSRLKNAGFFVSATEGPKILVTQNTINIGNSTVSITNSTVYLATSNVSAHGGGDKPIHVAASATFPPNTATTLAQAQRVATADPPPPASSPNPDETVASSTLTTVTTTTANSKPRQLSITLVTSFWAQTPEETVTPHRREIEETILNNLNNPHIDQVVIILDGSSEDGGNCNHFRTRMDQLDIEFGQKMANYTGMPYSKVDNSSKPVLACVDRNDKQPTYYEMFRYATNPEIVTSDIVIMANADQAFDDSVKGARRIKPRTVMILPTSGFDKKLVPSPTRQHFLFLHGKDSEPYQEGVTPRCRPRMQSWDGFVFHRKLFGDNGTRLKNVDFMRDTTAQKRAYFKMNEEGAENAALWALWINVREAKYVKTCELIQMWHFHGAAKMHARHGKKGERYWDNPQPDNTKVPEPWRKPIIPSPKHPNFLNAYVNDE